MQTGRTNRVDRPSDIGIALDEPASAAAASASPFRKDDWASRQRVRSLNRELQRATVFSRPARSSVVPRRIDPSQDLFANWGQTTLPAVITTGTTLPVSAIVESRHGRASQVISWLIIAAGAIALAAGVGLVGWSIATHNFEYWQLAFGLALGGQGALILGLVLVVSRLWRNSRYASNKLQDVQSRLIQLQTTADSLVTMRSGGAPAFYADLVRGASPQVLLANLKGQVDQLATRIGSGW
jgi:hypothetical protein